MTVAQELAKTLWQIPLGECSLEEAVALLREAAVKHADEGIRELVADYLAEPVEIERQATEAAIEGWEKEVNRLYAALFGSDKLRQALERKQNVGELLALDPRSKSHFSLRAKLEKDLLAVEAFFAEPEVIAVDSGEVEPVLITADEQAADEGLQLTIEAAEIEMEEAASVPPPEFVCAECGEPVESADDLIAGLCVECAVEAEKAEKWANERDKAEKLARLPHVIADPAGAMAQTQKALQIAEAEQRAIQDLLARNEAEREGLLEKGKQIIDRAIDRAFDQAEPVQEEGIVDMASLLTVFESFERASNLYTAYDGRVKDGKGKSELYKDAIAAGIQVLKGDTLLALVRKVATFVGLEWDIKAEPEMVTPEASPEVKAEVAKAEATIPEKAPQQRDYKTIAMLCLKNVDAATTDEDRLLWGFRHNWAAAMAKGNKDEADRWERSYRATEALAKVQAAKAQTHTASQVDIEAEAHPQANDLNTFFEGTVEEIAERMSVAALAAGVHGAYTKKSHKGLEFHVPKGAAIWLLCPGADIDAFRHNAYVTIGSWTRGLNGHSWKFDIRKA